MDCTRSPRAELIPSGGPGPRFSSYVFTGSPEHSFSPAHTGPPGDPTARQEQGTAGAWLRVTSFHTRSLARTGDSKDTSLKPKLQTGFRGWDDARGDRRGLGWG